MQLLRNKTVFIFLAFPGSLQLTEFINRQGKVKFFFDLTNNNSIIVI